MAPKPKKRNVILEAIVRIKTEGAQKSLGSIINVLGKSAAPLLALQAGLGLATQGFQKLAAAGGTAYNLLINQNEQLNQQIIKSASIIATNTRQIDQFGNEIKDTQAELINLQGPLRQAVLDLQIETRELAGVTTRQVNESFTAVLQNYNRLVGQTKRNNGDVLKSSVELTKGVVAAVGTIGLPLQQVQQEIRAILQGDLKNPDALLAKTLQISREEFDKARAQGELIDLLIEKFDTFVVANQLASQSIGNITVNIQDFFEQVARATGEPLLDPVIESLAKFQKFLFSIQDQAEAIGSIIGQDAALAIEQFLGIIEEGVELLKPAIDLIGSLLISALRIAIKFITGLLANIRFSLKVINAFRDGLENIRLAIVGALENLGAFGEGLLKLGFLFENPTKNVAKLVEDIASFGDDSGSFEDLADGVDKLGVKFGEVGAKIVEQRRLIKATQEDQSLNETERKEAVKRQIADLNKLIKQQKKLNKAIDRKEIIVKSRDAQSKADKEAQKAALDRIATTRKEANQVETLSNRLESTGTIAEQSIKALQTARRSATDAVDLETLKKANKELLTSTQLAFELGQIDLTEAIRDIQTVGTDERITAQERLEALKAVDKLFKQQLAARKETLDIEKAIVELSVANGELSNGQSKVELERIKLKEQELKLEQAIQKLQLQTAAGTPATIERAQNQVDLLESQIEGTVEKIENLEFANLQKGFDRLIKQSERLSSFYDAEVRAEIEQFASQSVDFIGEIQEAQARADRFQIEDQIAISDLRLKGLQEQLETAQTIDDQRKLTVALEEEETKRLKLATKLSEQTKAAQQAQLALIAETEDRTERDFRLRQARAAQERQELLGNLALSQQSAAIQSTINRLEIQNLREQIEARRQIFEAEETRADQRIAVGKELFGLETELANTVRQELEARIKIETELRNLQKETLTINTELVEKSLSRQQNLLQTQADLEASINSLEKARFDNQLSIVDEKRKLLKISQDDNATAQERAEAERQLRDLGGARTAQTIENERAQLLADAIETEKAGILARINLTEKLLELERQRAQIQAQVAASEAAQKQLEVESRILDLQNQRRQAADANDGEAVELLTRQIALQRNIAGLVRERAAFAEEEADLVSTTFDARRAAQQFEAQQQIEAFQLRSGQRVRRGRLDAASEGLRSGIRTPDLEAQIGRLPETADLFAGLNRQTEEFKATFRQTSEAQQLALREVNASVRELLAETRRQQGVDGTTESNVTVNNNVAPDIASAVRLLGLN